MVQSDDEKKEEIVMPVSPSIVLEVVDTAVKKPKPFRP
jgi:hypothetical protein